MIGAEWTESLDKCIVQEGILGASMQLQSIDINFFGQSAEMTSVVCSVNPRSPVCCRTASDAPVKNCVTYYPHCLNSILTIRQSIAMM
jgi:hypothetical protein